MKVFQLLICIVTIYHASHATIRFDKVKTNIFDRLDRNFEQDVNLAMRETKDFFGRDDVLLGLAVGLVVAMEYAPFIQKFIQIAPLFRDTMESNSDWSATFANTISNQTTHQILEGDIRGMTTAMETVQAKIPLLNASNADKDNQKTVASIIHTELDRMINFFKAKDSLFRKYPLVAGPPLLQLASLVAIFSPLGK